MKRLSAILGVLLTVIGCSSHRGVVPLHSEGDAIPSVLPNFSREVQSSDQPDTVRVSGSIQTTVETIR